MNSLPNFTLRRPLPRRAFLKGLAAAPVCLSFARSFAAESAAPQPASNGPIGRVLDVADEVKEYKDKETGARVIFGSNRTGKFQHYMLEIKRRKLIQLTDGKDISPTKACLGRG